MHEVLTAATLVKLGQKYDFKKRIKKPPTSLRRIIDAQKKLQKKRILVLGSVVVEK